MVNTADSKRYPCMYRSESIRAISVALHVQKYMRSLTHLRHRAQVAAPAGDGPGHVMSVSRTKAASGAAIYTGLHGLHVLGILRTIKSHLQRMAVRRGQNGHTRGLLLYLPHAWTKALSTARAHEGAMTL